MIAAPEAAQQGASLFECTCSAHVRYLAVKLSCIWPLSVRLGTIKLTPSRFKSRHELYEDETLD